MNLRKRQLAKKIAFVRSPLGRRLAEERISINAFIRRFAEIPMDQIKMGIIDSFTIQRGIPGRHRKLRRVGHRRRRSMVGQTERLARTALTVEQIAETCKPLGCEFCAAVHVANLWRPIHQIQNIRHGRTLPSRNANLTNHKEP